MASPISDKLRVDYSGELLLESEVDPDPFLQFKRWFEEAVKSDIPQANAMTLATVDQNARPSARIVLMKEFDARGFVFHTSYRGRKARELDANPHAAIVFFWEKLHRQVRVEGAVQKTTREESATYFSTRPREAQIGAWASDQSSPIDSRDFLLSREAELTRNFQGSSVPLPDFWGGYRLIPTHFEFWQGQPSRLHDRLTYSRDTKGKWKISRLSP